MKFKNNFKLLLAALMLLQGVSCDDFYNPDNSTVKYGDDYIRENSELYAGYVGLGTKLQAMGDKTILLTEPRGEMMEVVGFTDELLALYNYEDDLKGNSYADPAVYYDVIIACNDYLHKARAYNDANRISVDQDHYKALISGTLRIKAWVYFTLGKVYGKAVWFDDPITKPENTDQYPVKNLDEIIAACVDLIDGAGFDGIDGKYEMSWTDYILASAGETETGTMTFYYWDMMAPPYFVLAADLALWQDRFQDVIDLVLPQMNATFENERGSTTVRWLCNDTWGYQYNYSFSKSRLSTTFPIGLIYYQADKDQTNRLFSHFYFTGYLLRPSANGVARYEDSEFNPFPSGVTDNRFNFLFSKLSSSTIENPEYRLNKFTGASSSNADDLQVYMYRHIDLYFMLAEAFNHLGKYNELDALINRGASYYIYEQGIELDGFSVYWGDNYHSGSKGDRGIRTGAQGRTGNAVQPRNFKEPVTPENIEHNDMEILREIILEQVAEGKNYPAMIRMARRYNDYGIIADLVSGKYEEPAQREKVRSKILAGAYFVPWDLSWETSKQ